jgi:hypothetical protein
MDPVSPSESDEEVVVVEEEDDDDSDYDGSGGSPTSPGKSRSKGKGKEKAKVMKKLRKRHRPMPESPVPPKRRRVDAPSRSVREREVGGGAGTERVRSALDVLADQAAAAATPPGKGKTKSKAADAFVGTPSTSTSLHPRPRPKTPLAENGTWSMLKPVQWGPEEASSSPVVEEGDEGEVVSRRDRVELERMVLDTLVGAEERVGRSPPPLGSSPPPLSQSQSQSGRSGIPDVFGSTVRVSSPPVSHLQSRGNPAPAGSSTNVDSQPQPRSSEDAAPSTANIHRATSPPHPFVDHTHDELGNVHARRETAPELNTLGLVTMSDFDLAGFQEDVELEQAMHRDLARVGDTPGKRPRSAYVKWSKDEDDLLAQVS